MEPTLSQYLEVQWSTAEPVLLQAPTTAVNYLIESLDIQPDEHLICDPLIPDVFLEGFKKRGIQIIFIDLQAPKGGFDLALLEDFLSLSSLINEKDELIYRKDNQAIKGIISSTAWIDRKALQNFLFITKRYFLKSISLAAQNDLLSSEASQQYQADLIIGAIESAASKAHLILKPTAQNNLPSLSMFAKPLQTPALQEADKVPFENFLLPTTVPKKQANERDNITTLHLPSFLPGYAEVLDQNRAALKDHLITQGWNCLIPFNGRKEALKNYTFLSRSKAAAQYLSQSLRVQITRLSEIQLLEEILKAKNKTKNL